MLKEESSQKSYSAQEDNHYGFMHLCQKRLVMGVFRADWRDLYALQNMAMPIIEFKLTTDFIKMFHIQYTRRNNFVP